jgi:hypothetical protein
MAKNVIWLSQDTPQKVIASVAYLAAKSLSRNRVEDLTEQSTVGRENTYDSVQAVNATLLGRMNH